jgi:starch-binding outer membrane protein, SusD/RagB family
MKRIINIFLITILFFLIQSSCSEEWLEPKPLSIFAPENVYVNETGFRSLLNTMRIDMKMECYGQPNFFQMEVAASDMAVVRDQADFSFLTPSGSLWRFLSMYTLAYSYIKNSNILITRIDDIEWPIEQVRNEILAEALFYRSYWYYRLVTTYGDSPWIGEEITGTKLDFQSHSRWAIIDQIQSDMEFAVQWLPETAHIGELTKYAGYQLLTKIYLANTEFDKAISSATEIINGPFALMTERFGSWRSDPNRNVLWDLHRVENKNLPENTETILALVDRFEAPPDAKSDGNNLSQIYHPRWWINPDETGARGFDWTNAQGDTLGQGANLVPLNYWSNYSIWSEFGYNWETTPDLRRADINWIEMEEMTYSVPTSPNFGEPANIIFLANPADTLMDWRPLPFYKTFMPPEFGKPTGRPRGGNGDMYIYRLAETFLLRAEAYFWKDQYDLAADDINAVRRRANAVEISSGDVTIDYIFDERARELLTEEPRHSEMVRVANIMARLNLNGYSLNNLHENNWYYDRIMKYNDHYTEPKWNFFGGPPAQIFPYNIYWPIPESVITANTMGVINQNMGYTGAENNIPPIEIIE